MLYQGEHSYNPRQLGGNTKLESAILSMRPIAVGDRAGVALPSNDVTKMDAIRLLYNRTCTSTKPPDSIAPPPNSISITTNLDSISIPHFTQSHAANKSFPSRATPGLEGYDESRPAENNPPLMTDLRSGRRPETPRNDIGRQPLLDDTVLRSSASTPGQC